MVFKHIDGELWRCRNERAIRPRQVDRVETGLLHGEACHQRAVVLECERVCGYSVQDELAAGCHHGRSDPDLHDGAGQGRNVTAVFSRARFESSVGREEVREVQLIDVRQVGNIDRVRG